jgi:integrase
MVDNHGEEMPLTDLQIKTLKPRDIRYAVSDGRGLALEVMPTGAASWRYRYQFKGKTEKVSLGKYPLLSLKDARMKRDEFAKAVHEGESPAKQKQLEKFAMANATSVFDFSERYFKEVIERDRKDTKQLRRYLEKEIYPAFGALSLRDVTAQDVQRLVFRKRDNGFESAAAQLRNLLKRIFDYAIVCGVITVNPTHATPMRFITRARPRTRSLSSEELKTYLQILYRSNIRRQFKLALHIILLTLVRKSELMHARWINVRLEAGEWLIPEEQSKTGKPHTVYLSEQVREMFQELRDLAGDSELVLPGRGSLTKPFASNALNQAMGAMSFPIPPFTIHDLRRTGSTILHEQGFSSDVVEKALNHTIGGVRGVYNRAEYADQRKAMLQSWANYISSLNVQLHN